jgi:hypothetical protein
MVNPEDLELVTITEDVEETVALLEACHGLQVQACAADHTQRGNGDASTAR